MSAHLIEFVQGAKILSKFMKEEFILKARRLLYTHFFAIPVLKTSKIDDKCWLVSPKANLILVSYHIKRVLQEEFMLRVTYITCILSLPIKRYSLYLKCFHHIKDKKVEFIKEASSHFGSDLIFLAHQSFTVCVRYSSTFQESNRLGIFYRNAW